MVKRKKKAAPSSNGSIVWILLIASLAGNLYQYTHSQSVKPAPGPDTVVVDDNKPKPPKPEPKPDVVLKECKLVTIADKSAINEDTDYMLTMQDDAFWDEMQSKLADVEHVDARDELAKKWIADANLTPPVVLLVNGKKVIWTMPLPKGGTSAIRKKIGL